MNPKLKLVLVFLCVGLSAGAQPLLRVNETSGSRTVPYTEPLLGDVTMTGVPNGKGDYWLLLYSPEGSLWYYDLVEDAWRPGLLPTAQGPLVDIPGLLLFRSHPVIPVENTPFILGLTPTRMGGSIPGFW
jgi:hypothetical protein